MHWSRQTQCRLPDTLCTVKIESFKKFWNKIWLTLNLNLTTKTSEFELVINIEIVDHWISFPTNFKSSRTKVKSKRYKFFNQPLSKPSFHSKLKFKFAYFKTLSTDSQLLQIDWTPIKSSYKHQSTSNSAFQNSFQK